MIMQSMKSLCFAILSLSLFVSSGYSVPPVINYAGQVAVDGEAFDGNGLFKFAIVNDSGNITYWSNDSTSNAGSEPTTSVSVSVSGGLYSVLLGNSAIQGMNAIDPAVFQQHADARLRVWFNDGTNGFQQLTPDRSFASVPYALSAGSAGYANIAPGSINGSMLAPSLLSDLNSSISDGSVSTAKMDPNLVRYFIPEISANPVAVSIIQGTDTTLSVQADGKFLSYQWQKNGANLAGQTNPSLVLSNANASADDANYSVVISNDWGSVTSPLARVTVATALPTITILGSTTLVHEAATSYADAGATAVDALGGDLTSSISITSADINVTNVGDKVVTYSVTDAGGNTNTASRTVTVQDTTAPILTLNGDSNFTHNLNTAWADPGYDANDTLDGNLTASVSISGTVDVNSTGTYTLNYFVSDAAGNQVDINRTVNVAPMGPWTFTNAGATGRFGPTQAQIDANYSGTSLEGAVTINATHQGIQEWTVPTAGTYRIEALGAQGGSGGYQSFSTQASSGGRGGYSKGSKYFNAGTVLFISVGQKGEGYPSSSSLMSDFPGVKYGGWNGGGDNLATTHPGTGGGGSSDIRMGGVTLTSRIIVAGGGGGGGNSGSTTQLSNGGDGGGLVAESKPSSSQFGSRIPGSGGTQQAGFQLGNGQPASLNYAGGGGGGYYGGTAGANSTGGGGGSSFIGGVQNGSTIGGLNVGDGKVIITFIEN
jgi:hypothetical protein